MSNRDMKGIDWGRTSQDYSAYRPNYPNQFYDLLACFGVGTPGQSILDLGTGVGFLAERFAKAGAAVTGIDISEAQIEEARLRCRTMANAPSFFVRSAESTGFESSSFDVLTASQSWLYFDADTTVGEAKRLLRPRGKLVTSHFSWLPSDPIAFASEQLVLKHNPSWTGANWSGQIPQVPKWSAGHFEMDGMFVFDADIPFTAESWRGRMRACRGVGASMTGAQVQMFDLEHASLLERIAGPAFTVKHRIDAHIMRLSAV
jgi:SAM-dependent methyltransferase